MPTTQHTDVWQEARLTKVLTVRIRPIETIIRKLWGEKNCNRALAEVNDGDDGADDDDDDTSNKMVCYHGKSYYKNTEVSKEKS